MFFKDIKIGELFYCWGDHDLNYNYPKICLMVKVDNRSATEVENEECYYWLGMSAFFSDNDKYSLFDLEDLKDPDMLSKYNNYIKNKSELFKEKK